MRKLIFILSVLLLLAPACQRKILLEPGHKHGEEIYVNINVDVAVDTDVELGDDPDLYKDIIKTARTVTIVAYPLDENGHFGIHTINGLEGTIWLLPGRYDLLIYTSDFYELDGVHYRGIGDLASAEAYTSQIELARSKADTKAYSISEPDPLFVHLYEDFEVTYGENRLESGLQPMSYKYWYEVHVDGLDYITSAYLDIDGMYTSVFMKDESHRADEYGVQRAESTIHKDENKIKGEFFSFGPHQDSDVKNSIIMQDAQIQEGAEIDHCILDKGAVIRRNGSRSACTDRLACNIRHPGGQTGDLHRRIQHISWRKC